MRTRLEGSRFDRAQWSRELVLSPSWPKRVTCSRLPGLAPSLRCTIDALVLTSFPNRSVGALKIALGNSLEPPVLPFSSRSRGTT